MFREKMDIRLPGPTPVPPQVTRAILETMNAPYMDYRNEEFRRVVSDTVKRLKSVFRTEGDILLLAGSGTSALQTAMVNVIGPGDTVIVAVMGFFGEYLADIAKQAGANLVRIDSEWGQPTDPEAIRDALRQHPDAKAVFVTHCETSTSVVNDLKAIGDAVKGSGALLLVDAVSSVGAIELNMDEWGIDIVAAGCQKGLMTPPGLGVVAVNERAWDVIEKSPRPSFYFDLMRYKEFIQTGQTPYTPNVAMVKGLAAAIDLLEEEGLDNTFRRHVVLRDMTRAAMKALGVPCLVEDDAHASPVVTTVIIDQADPHVFRNHVRSELRVALAAGLGKLKDKTVRIAHMGYTDAGDVLKTIAAVEVGLRRVGYAVELGAGVAAAQRVWLERQAVAHV